MAIPFILHSRGVLHYLKCRRSTFEILTKFAVHLKFRNLKFQKYPDIFGYFCKFEVILVEIQLKFSLKFEIQPKNLKISNVIEGFCE